MEESEIKIIKESIEEFLQKMTVTVFNVEIKAFLVNDKECVSVDINVREPQILIGQNGQTLFEFQRLLRIILNKKLSRLRNNRESSTESGQKDQSTNQSTFLKVLGGARPSPQLVEGSGFYLDLDIDNYKKQKIEYLKRMAKNSADEVSITKEKKVLSPMPSYERRVIHSELSQRQDVITESQGDGFERYIVISPR